MIRRLAYSNPPAETVGSVSLSPQPGYTWLIREIIVSSVLTSTVGDRSLQLEIYHASVSDAIATSVSEILFNSALTASASVGWYYGPIPGVVVSGITTSTAVLLQTPIYITADDSLRINAGSYLASDYLQWVIILEEVLG